MKPVKSKKDRFHRLEAQRLKLVEYLLSDCPLLHGSYTELLVKCGRAGCHCQKKPAHLVARLGTRKDGIPQNRVVRVADRQHVKALVKSYKKHKESLGELKQIHVQQEQLVKSILNDKDEPYE